MNNELYKRILSSIVLIPLTLYFVLKGEFLFNIFILLCLFLSIYEWIKMNNKKIIIFLGVLFLFFSFFSIYKLRNDLESEYFHLLFVLVVCVSTDIGGYAFGKLFKGPKLTKISPNKTISGFIGGLMLSVISIYLFSIMIKSTYIVKYQINVILIILIISSVSQIGDITISYFKRLSQVKDTGKLIPGHGGILDRVDGMIFAFPFFYILNSLNLINF